MMNILTKQKKEYNLHFHYRELSFNVKKGVVFSERYVVAAMWQTFMLCSVIMHLPAMHVVCYILWNNKAALDPHPFTTEIEF